MGRILRATNGGFAMSTGPMVMLGMLVLSISIMSLLVFACTESASSKRKREKKSDKKKRDKKSDKKRDKKSGKKKRKGGADVDYGGCIGCCCDGGHGADGGDGGGGGCGGGGCGGGGGGG